MIVSVPVVLDELTVSNGYVYARPTDPMSGLYTGAMRCATSATCLAAPSIIAIGSDEFDEFAVGTKLAYTLDGTTTMGSIHTAALDGTSDAILLANAAYPLHIALSGSRTFWVDDPITGSGGTDTTPSTVHCLGCSAGDVTWMGNLNGTYALYADSSDVYVLADDSPTSGTLGIYGCSVSAACGASPITVTTGLDATITPAQVTSDGTAVYASRTDQHDVIRVSGGTTTSVVTDVTATAVAVDATTGDLFYGENGALFRTKSDGSSASVTVSGCGKYIAAIAYDATSVYVLLPLEVGSGIYAIPR
jgi:hypothetical protein